MAKFDNPMQIGKSSVEPDAGLSFAGGDDDFLNRVNLTINNFKELVKLVNQFRQVNQEAGGDYMNETKHNPKSTKETLGLTDYLNMMITRGYGDTPIGELIAKVSPYTLKQIMGVFNRVGFKQ